MRVADTLDDLVDVCGLGLLRDAVLGDDEVLGLVQSTADLSHDGLVLKSIVDGALSAVVTVVGSGGVASVDSEELALNEGSKVVNPVDALNLRDTNILEGSLVDNPLKELLKSHVKTSIGVLSGDDSVNGRVGVAGALVMVLEALGSSVLGILDEGGEGVGGIDGVLASNDVERALVLSTAVDTLGNDGSDKLEDVGTNGTGYNLSLADLLNQVLLVILGVDGAVIRDDGLGCAFDANLDDAI